MSAADGQPPPAPEPATRAVLEALAAAGVDPRPAARGWTLTLSRDFPLAALAYLDEGWLLIRAPAAPRPDGEPGESLQHRALLGASGLLPGSAKFALGGSPPRLVLAAEVAVAQARELGPLVVEAIAGLRWGAHLLAGGGLPPALALGGAAPPRPAGAAAPPGSLGEVLREAGWAFEERSPGRGRVELEGEPALSAEIEALEGGGVRAGVELARFRWEAVAPSCRDALLHFLLTVSGVVRSVRAILWDMEEETTARLETRFGSRPGPAAAACALGALSVGAALCAREARILLEDESCARAYLALRRFPQGAAGGVQERKE